MRACRVQILLALLLLCGQGGAALVPAAARGVDYIVGCQRADGRWSDKAVVVDGVAALSALWGIAESSVSLARLLGQSALLLQHDWPGDELPGVLMAYICGGCDKLSLLQPFAVADAGGWCMVLGARADVLSTVLVGEALLMAAEPDQTALATARDYLLTQRCADGSWRLCSQAAPGDLRLTARVAGLLARINTLLSVDGGEVAGDLQRAIAALLPGVVEKGLVGVAASGPSASVLVDMAWVLQALCQVGLWADAKVLYHALVSAQHVDGSWGDGDASQVLRTTCAIVSALRCFAISGGRLRPDLAIPASSLRLQMPAGGGMWRFSGMVFNDGLSESLPCGWEVHCGLPGENTLIAQGRVSALVAGGSCKLYADVPPSMEASTLYVLIDSEGKSGDGYRVNNVARLECRPVPESDKMSLWLSPLTVASEGAPEILLLRPGGGAMVSALLWAVGPLPAEPLQAVLLDNGWEYHRWDIAFGGDGLTECRSEWFPGVGGHELIMRVLQGDDLVAERTVCVEVSYDDVLLRIDAGAGGASEGLPQYGAAEYVTVRLYTAEDGAAVDLWVADEQDDRLDVPLVSASLEGRYTWHTGVQPPGHYRMYAQMTDGSGGAAADFVIVPSYAVCEASILQPDFAGRIGVGDTVQMPIVVSWTQVCNSTRCLHLSWTWSGPSGTVVAEAEAVHEFTCVPGALTQQLALPEVAKLHFPYAGSYVLRVVITGGETVLTAERSVRAIALPLLIVEQMIQPEKLGWAACDVAVCTTVKLRGGAGSAGKGLHIPESMALPPLADDPSRVLDIVLEGICDDDGQIIEKGTLLARVLYGHCGDVAASGDAAVGELFAIADGVCHISYSPGGCVLSAGMSAPVIIALYDPQTDQGVGCLEVHVEGGNETKR